MRDRSESGVWFWTLLAFGFVAATWCATWYFLRNQEQRGTFGDMFGGTNALFTGLAFVGVIATILLQRLDLKRQAQELQETREEFRGQRKQLELQSATFLLQRFEGTFFQLFNLYVTIADATLRREPTARKGNLMELTRMRMNSEILAEMSAHETFEDCVSAAYRTVLNDRTFAFLPRYYRALYSVLSYVDRSQVDDPRFYANLIRSEFTEDECVLLAYIGLTDIGRAKLKPLIERYKLLKHVPSQFLFDHQPLFKAYHRSAFRNDLPPILSKHSTGTLLEEWAASQQKG
ncbi:putative phage abortive infection protein [Methyloversatilis universalis]|nr:putative phage abortive infection protein [Methyloversatilis universalis]